MKREIRCIQLAVATPDVPSDFDGDLKTWLTTQAQKHDLRWLLAHADDGVIWGEMVGGELQLSSDTFDQVSPPLRLAILQQARLFGPDGELFLWRKDSGWGARLVREGEGEEAEVFDERYLLWGTHLEEQKGRFALLRQGAEGLLHAPPIRPDTSNDQELVDVPCLVVRHVLDYDPDGQARVAFSRLVSVHPSE
jgi:CRISPR-associated protein (TIGR03984 family)